MDDMTQDWMLHEHVAQEDAKRTLTRVDELANGLTSDRLIGEGKSSRLYVNGSGAADQALVVFGAGNQPISF